MSRIPISIALWAIATALYGCIEPANSTDKPPIYSSSANPPADAMPYGVDGTLDEQQINALLHLQFPQSYDAIKDRLGLPAYRDDIADYYRVPTGRGIKISYQGQQATAFQFGDN